MKNIFLCSVIVPYMFVLFSILTEPGIIPSAEYQLTSL